MANTYLTKTLGTPTNNKRWTFSAWVKKAHTGGDINTLFGAGGDSSNIGLIWVNYSNGMIQFHSQTSGGLTGGSVRLLSKLRDVAAWYHIVVSFDSANSTAADRVKIYINGIRGTNFDGTPDYPNLNIASFINSNIAHTVGKDPHRSAGYYDGSASHIHFIDGTVYAASSFGSTDSTTGEWTINTGPNVTYGNNGFAILKDGNTITDQSPNSNNFSLGSGAVTTIKDCPATNFATMNPLFAGDANITYSNGNLKTTAANASQKNAVSTIAVSSGKWYCEMVSRNGTNYPGYGIMDSQSVLQSSVSYLGSSSDSYCMFQDGNYYTNGSASSTGTTWGVGSIMGVAIDLDSSTKTIKFFKNGSQTHSATIATPANAYVFAVSHNTNGTITEINFGNGFFGTTAITTNSGNGYAGAEGKSKFNYQPPSGYSALNTKGLNQ